MELSTKTTLNNLSQLIYDTNKSCIDSIIKIQNDETLSDKEKIHYENILESIRKSCHTDHAFLLSKI